MQAFVNTGHLILLYRAAGAKGKRHLLCAAHWSCRENDYRTGDNRERRRERISNRSTCYQEIRQIEGGRERAWDNRSEEKEESFLTNVRESGDDLVYGTNPVLNAVKCKEDRYTVFLYTRGRMEQSRRG